MKAPRRAGGTRMATFFYVFLLVYTVTQLVWWGLLLHEQSRQIAALQREVAITRTQGELSATRQQTLERIDREARLRTWQYLGEGGIFLLIVMLAALYVFRSMRRQIRFSRQQHNFMMAVTHELKSPIASAKLNLETLKKHQLEPERQRKFLDNTLREVERLNQLSSNMLLASQFESRQYHLVRERTDCSILVRQAVQDFRARQPERLVEAELEDDVFVTADTLMLQIALSNLLENAAKYSPKERPVAVTLSRREGQARLAVADQGAGIPVAERRKIFGRFYRIGNEYTRKAKGTGLGLFLTRKIVEQHGGRIRVLDNSPCGSVFEILLPLS